MKYIDRILNQQPSEADAETLRSIAIDLKCLALYLGVFQSDLERRSPDQRTFPTELLVQRAHIESQWMSTGMGLHILCLNILRNYNNKQWLDQVHSTFFMR